MEVLLVGVDPDAAAMVERVFSVRGHRHRLASDGASALEALRADTALVVVQSPLADMMVADFCRLARTTANGTHAVILVVTAGEDELPAVLDAGATDLYVTSLGPAAFETRLLIAERLVMSHAELRRREARFRRLFESGVAGVTIADLDGAFKEANDAFLAMLGYTRDEMHAGALTWDVITPPDRWAPDREARAQLRATGFLPLRERTYIHKDGSPVAALVGAALLPDSGEYVTYVTDLTEKKRAEDLLRTTTDHLRQAQKMEAIGNLAGGVAHDFNNLLAVILSYSGMIIAELKVGDPIRGDLEQVQRAAERAADLTRQLLAFSRQQVLQPRVLDLNQVVRSMEPMLGRLLREDIELSILTAKRLGRVLADPGQIEQVVMNLAVNAHDAMPGGGHLSIETANVELDASYAAAHFGVEPGAYVMLAVADTGCGMEAATRERIFEPFFTTKEQSKGTGLGLATLFGIVKQSGGHVWVYSELGIGSTFKVYLPRTDREVETISSPAVLDSLSGWETILLVEDEDQVRVLAKAILQRNGYHVLDARNGGEALLIAEQFDAKVQLLMTDVVMPRMGGRQLFERLGPLRPEMKALFMSGYTDDAIVHHGVLGSGIAFLQKPFTPNALLTKVRQTLGPARV